MGASAAADDRPDPVRLRDHPPREPRPRADLARRDGGRPVVVHRRLAERARHSAPVRSRPHPHRPRLPGAVPAPPSPASGGGRLAARAGAGPAGPARVARRGHAGRARDVRLRGFVQHRHADPVGAPPGGRRAPAPRDRAGLDPRVSRPPRLAAAPSLVSARGLRAVRPGAAGAGAGGARLRPGRPPGGGARPRGGGPRRRAARRQGAAAGRRRGPRRDPRRSPLGVRRGAGRRHRRPRRAVVARAPGRLGPPPVSRRP